VLPHKVLSSLSNPSVLLTSNASSHLKAGFAKLGPKGAALAKALLHGVKTALAMSTDRVFFLGMLLLAAALLVLFFLREIALKKVSGDVALVPQGPSLNRASARAVLGLTLAKRAQEGGFASAEERDSAREVAAQLLAQYLAYQDAVSVGEAELAATTD
jgi:hypothetical protein